MSECVACRTLDRVRALTRIVAPGDPLVLALGVGVVVATNQGFSAGVLMRIQAGEEPLFWRIYNSANVTDSKELTAQNGIPLAAWDRVDIELTKTSFFRFLLSPNAAQQSATVVLWPTDVLRMDPSGIDTSGYERAP